MGEVAFTFREIEFREVHPGSPKSKRGRDASELVAVYKVPWNLKDRAEIALTGKTDSGSTTLPDGSTQHYPKRTPPHFYPNRPTLHCVEIVDSIGVGPRGKETDDTAKFEWAIITARYRGLPFRVDEDHTVSVDGIPDESLFSVAGSEAPMRYITKRTGSTVSQLNYEAGSWHWLEGPNAGHTPPRTVPTRVAVMFHTGVIEYTHHELPRELVNEDEIIDSIGMVNKFKFDGKDPFTLLLADARIEPTTAADDTLSANVILTMKFNRHTWYRIPDVKAGNEFYLIGRGDRRLMGPQDFRKLFKLRNDPA